MDARSSEIAIETALARLAQTTTALVSAPLDDPLALVAGALTTRSRADEVLASAVDHARAAGVTWQAIGDLLGTTRQAAFQRFGHPIDPRTGAPMNTTTLPDAGPRATAVFTRIAAGEWDAVYADFDDTMRREITPKKLAEGWAQAAAMVGAFERQGEPFVRGADGLTVVDIPLAFEAGDLVGRAAFAADGRIAGLFILPPSAAAEL